MYVMFNVYRSKHQFIWLGCTQAHTVVLEQMFLVLSSYFCLPTYKEQRQKMQIWWNAGSLCLSIHQRKQINNETKQKYVHCTMQAHNYTLASWSTYVKNVVGLKMSGFYRLSHFLFVFFSRWFRNFERKTLKQNQNSVDLLENREEKLK